MPSTFDPYRVWLGIPPEEQPPNHYRLLGAAPFEAKPAAIEHAANQRIAHLRTFQTGKHSALSQKLLNEVAAAKACLLNPGKKAAYDRHLRQALEAQGRKSKKRHAAQDLTGSATGVYQPEPAASGTATVKGLGRLGEYELLEKLGEGGMGVVYKALHTKLGREVALKVLPKRRLRDEHAVARFEREMKAIGALDHPNIVRAFDAREVKGIRFLVMEFVDGMDLANLVDCEGPLPVAEACEVIRQAALGLQCAHEHDLVHRDVKPSNLMLSSQGQVKLLDLGVARFQFQQRPGEEMTGTDQVLGTLDYMAPEQISSTRTVDIRADIYSLGCTLYKLLTGRAPFTGHEYESAYEKMQAHAEKPPPRIRRLRGDVPKELATIVHRMLAKDPARRYDTPAEVADAVGPFTCTADLSGLLARAGQEPLVTPPDQSLEATAGSSSSGLTEFLGRLKVESQPQRQAHAAAKKPPAKLAVKIGVPAVAVLLMLGFIVWGFSTGEKPVPETAPVEITEAEQARGNLILQWSREERQDVRFEIDGCRPEIPPKQSTAAHVKLPLEPGKHKVRIDRSGFEPFEEAFTIVKGEDVPIEVVFRPVPEPDEPPENPPPPPPEKLPVPDNGVQQQIAETINQEHGVAEAKKDAAKSKLARKLLDLGKQPNEDTAKQFVLLRRAKELAIEASNKALMDEAVDAIIERFKVDSKQEKADAADRLAQVNREKLWLKTMAPVEKKVADWDFRGAAAAMETIRFDDQELAARLTQRRDEVARMAGLKDRMISKINAAKGLKKSDLGLVGVGGDVTGADEDGITAKLVTGTTESHPWHKLKPQARSLLLEFVVNRDSADDCLAAGLLALACKDATSAEKHFERARSLGADIGRYLTPLATAAFDRAIALIREGKFIEADAVLKNIEEKYAQIPWYASNKRAIDAAWRAAKDSIPEAAAERLYRQAAKLFAAGMIDRKKLFDLKPLIEKLNNDYGETRVVSDSARKPTFAEMQDAVDGLGKLIFVRQDGKGQFESIQAAIDDAPANSVIEIQDSGLYYEAIRISGDKEGLTLGGAKRCWPIIRSGGLLGAVGSLVVVDAPHVTLERLAIAQTFAQTSSTPPYPCSLHATQSCRLRSVVLGGTTHPLRIQCASGCHFENCLVMGSSPYLPSTVTAPVTIRNSIWLMPHLKISGSGKVQVENVIANKIVTEAATEIRNCTVSSEVQFRGGSSIICDSILGSVLSTTPDSRIEFCNVASGKFLKFAEPGKKCFSQNPHFSNPKALDYRLLPASPCRKKASDGKDLGFHYTDEMVELLDYAAVLRSMELISF